MHTTTINLPSDPLARTERTLETGSAMAAINGRMITVERHRAKAGGKRCVDHGAILAAPDVNDLIIAKLTYG